MGLAFCPNLTFLNLKNNDLRDIAGIETLPSLRTINLSSNDLKHVRGLAHCKALEEADLSTNDLTDLPSVLALATCPRLRTLNLQDNDFSKSQCGQIAKHFRQRDLVVTQVDAAVLRNPALDTRAVRVRPVSSPARDGEHSADGE